MDDALWERVQARRTQVRDTLPVSPDGSRSLMRGRNGALHSKNLFVGFLRCGTCGGAITVIYGRPGEIRYGCSRSHRNGLAACTNRLTVRAQVVDTHLLDGLRSELLRAETVRYISGELTYSIERSMRPRLRSRAREQTAQRLQRLVAAIESGFIPSGATIGESADGSPDAELMHWRNRRISVSP